MISPIIGTKNGLPDLARSHIQRNSAPSDGLTSIAVGITQCNDSIPYRIALGADSRVFQSVQDPVHAKATTESMKLCTAF